MSQSTSPDEPNTGSTIPSSPPQNMAKPGGDELTLIEGGEVPDLDPAALDVFAEQLNRIQESSIIKNDSGALAFCDLISRLMHERVSGKLAAPKRRTLLGLWRELRAHIIASRALQAPRIDTTEERRCWDGLLSILGETVIHDTPGITHALYQGKAVVSLSSVQFQKQEDLHDLLVQLMLLYDTLPPDCDWILDFSGLKQFPKEIFGALLCYQAQLVEARTGTMTLWFVRSEIAADPANAPVVSSFALQQMGAFWFSATGGLARNLIAGNAPKDEQSSHEPNTREILGHVCGCLLEFVELSATIKDSGSGIKIDAPALEHLIHVRQRMCKRNYGLLDLLESQIRLVKTTHNQISEAAEKLRTSGRKAQAYEEITHQLGRLDQTFQQVLFDSLELPSLHQDEDQLAGKYFLEELIGDDATSSANPLLQFDAVERVAICLLQCLERSPTDPNQGALAWLDPKGSGPIRALRSLCMIKRSRKEKILGLISQQIVLTEHSTREISSIKQEIELLDLSRSKHRSILESLNLSCSTLDKIMENTKRLLNIYASESEHIDPTRPWSWSNPLLGLKSS